MASIETGKWGENFLIQLILTKYLASSRAGQFQLRDRFDMWRRFKENINRVLTERLPLIKSAYLVGLAIVKLPIAGAMDYVICKCNRKGGQPGFLLIRLANGVLLRLRSNETDIKIFEQIFLLEDCLLPRGAPVPQTIIDDGAHIGCTALYFALRFPDARILAVEAEKENAKICKENLETFPNVEVVHAAIFGSEGVVRLDNPDGDPWGYRVSSVSKEGHHAGSQSSPVMMVPSVTIGSLVKRFDGQVDLVKLDIEGAEIEVFSDHAQQWLTSVKTLVVELHDRCRPGCSEAFYRAVSGYPATIHRTVHNVVWIRKP